jgi:magnesium chelatase subunit H
MFTQVKPTVRHIVPDDLRGRSLVKVVYVVLEAQYQSTLSEAVQTINRENRNIAIEISGYLIEELRNPENVEALKRDVAEANIFIASLIFIEDLAEKVVAAVEPRLPRCGCNLPFHAASDAPQQDGQFLDGAIGAIQECDRGLHAEAEGKIRFFLPRRDAEAAANPAQSLKISARRQSPRCPELHAVVPILAGGFFREPAKLPADVGG